ncbi:MAG: SDR family oxidoreductase [Bacteroidota bacterium]
MINKLNPKLRILVTGGAGFIGSNICEELLRNGNYVRCLDNLSTGSLSNISSFRNVKRFDFIQGDIRDLSVCYQSCNNIDYVLHQAALGSVPRSLENPINTNDVNITGFLNMLVAAKDYNVKRFIYAASSSTYGDSKALPKTEDVIGKPLSPYAVTKLVNELYADVFSKTYGLETIGLRYFNVFGKLQNPDGPYAAVIPKFVVSLLNHHSPKVNGDGTNSRDFTHVSNVVQANIKAILVQDKRAMNMVYNVAYGERTTISELASLLKQYLSEYDTRISGIPITYGKERVGDIKHSQASILKAQKLIGYNPKIDIGQGLKLTIPWYMENLVKGDVV